MRVIEIRDRFGLEALTETERPDPTPASAGPSRSCGRRKPAASPTSRP